MEYEIRGVKAIASQDVVGAVKAQLLVLLQILLGVGFSLWLVTVVLITVVFSMIVNERPKRRKARLNIQEDEPGKGHYVYHCDAQFLNRRSSETGAENAYRQT